MRSDPEEQTFRVSKIVKHGNFKPLGSGKEGDGRHDIALVSYFLTVSPPRGPINLLVFVTFQYDATWWHNFGLKPAVLGLFLGSSKEGNGRHDIALVSHFLTTSPPCVPINVLVFCHISI